MSTSINRAHIWRIRRNVSHLAWRYRIALGGLAAACALTVAVVTPEGQALAGQFLAQFRGQKLAVVAFDSSIVGRPFRELDRLGIVKGEAPGRGATVVASVVEAAQRTGLTPKVPDPSALPAGLSSAGQKFEITPARELRFTFDRDRARAYFQSMGRADLSLPDRFQGVSLVAAMPPTVMIEYPTGPQRAPLAVVQAGELAVGVEGNVSLADARDYLLSVPGLPADTARQIRGLSDWRTTLPIPVPIDRVQWKETSVAGGQGLLFEEKSGLGTAVIWQRDGRVYGVVGPFPAVDILRVANGLR